MRRWLRRLLVAFVLLVVALTVASFAYNAATSGREKPAAALYPGPYVVAGGTRIAYRSWGRSGSPIVLLGGAFEPSWVWHEVGPLLARHHRVYAVDLPPFGYTQRRGPYTLAGWTGLLRAFDQQLAIKRPVVVGHSLGAGVAVQDALRSGRGPSAIVLLDGDALPVGGGARWAFRLVVNPYFTSIYRIATGSDWIVRRIVSNALGPARTTHGEVEQFERPFRVDGTPSAIRAMIRGGIPGVSVDDLRRVRVRSLVVWGAKDTVDSVGAGRKTAGLLGAPFVLVPHAGHLSMLGNPAGVARAIERAAHG
jgi:pimeloyl-ACP methyl ester carboxylesterase